MNIRVGCDLVNIKKFKKSVQRGESKFLNAIFSKYELVTTPSVESLAGLFAVKEAVIKALGMKAGDWQKIEISKNKKGRPGIKMLELDKKVLSQDLSISHDGEYAMAVAVFLIKTADT